MKAVLVTAISIASLFTGCEGGSKAPPNQAERVDTRGVNGETYHFQCFRDTYTVVDANGKDSIGPFPVEAAQAGSSTMKLYLAVCRDSLTPR